MTHFVPYDQPRRVRRALCGERVTPSEESTVPTCLICVQALREDEAAIDALRDEKGEDPDA